jgi:hypothetical protein
MFAEHQAALELKLIHAQKENSRLELDKQKIGGRFRQAKQMAEQAEYQRDQMALELQALRSQLGQQNDVREAARSIVEPLARIATVATDFRGLAEDLVAELVHLSKLTGTFERAEDTLRLAAQQR